MNRVSWDLRMEPPEGAQQGPASGPPGTARLGPLVLPGLYTVTVNIGAGARILKGELKVEGDPRVNFSDADRRARQSTLLALYELQKSLAIARATSAAARVAADTRLAHLQSEIAAELNTATVLSRAIEGYSGLPTGDQRRQIDWLRDDAATTVEALNQVLRTELPVPARLAAVPPRRR
jgi:hypothetical protein